LFFHASGVVVGVEGEREGSNFKRQNLNPNKHPTISCPFTEGGNCLK